MIPIDKVQDIISRYKSLEKDLSSGSIEPKLIAKKSKEYSSLGEIIDIAREYVNFENQKRDLDYIIGDKTNDKEMVDLAQKDLNDLIKKKKKMKII